MTTDVDICNLALGEMGARSTITSMTETSPEAIACALRYNVLRDRMLRAANWGFARGTKVLSLLRAAPGTPENPISTMTQWTPDFPTLPWLYSYLYPPDAIRFRSVSPSTLYGAGAYPQISPVQSYIQQPSAGPLCNGSWQQAAEPDEDGNQCRVINTNVSQAMGCYTRRLTLPDSWDPSFQMAFVYRLAAALSVPLSGDKALRDRNYKLADDELRQVRVDDANEGTAQQNRVPDWIRVRGGRTVTGLPIVAPANLPSDSGGDINWNGDPGVWDVSPWDTGGSWTP